MQWCESRNPGALRRGATMLIDNGAISGRELDCDEPATPISPR